MRQAVRRFAAYLLLTVFIPTVFVLGPGFSTPARANLLGGDFGVKDEKELGEKFSILIKSSMPLVQDPIVLEYVQGIVERLRPHLPPQPFEINSSVIRRNGINAFAVPGGDVFIHTGLILNFETEEQVAGVLAHEMGHVAQRHISRTIQKSSRVSMLSLLGTLAGAFIGVAAGNPGLAQGLMIGSQAAGVSKQLEFSREHETEADSVAVGYLVKAGYSPVGLAQGLDLIRRKNRISGIVVPEYLRTHPLTENRIASLRQLISKQPEDVLHRSEDQSRFQRIKMLVRAKYTDPTVALQFFERNGEEANCLDLIGRAIVLRRAKRVSQAAEAFDEALKCLPGDPLIQREAGIYEFRHGSAQRAAVLLQQAYTRNPSDLLALFYLARLFDDGGERRRAIDYYGRVLSKLPDDPEVHYYLGRALGRERSYFDAHLHLAWSALYAADRSKLKFHSGKAKALAQNDSQKEELEKLNAAVELRSQFWQ